MKLRFILSAAFVAATLSTAHAQQLLRTVPGQTGSLYGSVIIRAGDQNGDGVEDVLIGAPGFNSNRGAIFCVSGKFLATGTGTSALWACAPPTLPGLEFGTSVLAVGNLVGSNAPDFVVGAPGAAGAGSLGAIYVVDGALHVVAATTTAVNTASVHPLRAGTSLALLGDVTGDGKVDIAVGAPGGTNGYLFALSGAAIMNSGGFDTAAFTTITAETGFATSIASGFDLNADGKKDVLVGSPLALVGSAAGAGRVDVYSMIAGGSLLGSYKPGIAGEHLGTSVDAAHDYDGDGKVDLVAGAPDFIGPGGGTDGRALVLSGAKVLANISPAELYILTGGSNGVGPAQSWRFGASVRASNDLNKDGVGDVLVGMPNYFTTVPAAPALGGANLYSGASGAQIGTLAGAINDHLGDGLCGAIVDFDGDGFPEFAVGGSSSDNPTLDCGTLKCYRLFPTVPGTYCTAKVNSLGCTPSIGSTGSPSASSISPFLVTCVNVLNKKNGLLFYSHKPAAIAFQGGLLCVHNPLKRTGSQNSGGSATGSDCTGTFSFDFNAEIHTGGDPTLIAGAEVFCQYWSRDVQSPSGTNLSNALRFVINP